MDLSPKFPTTFFEGEGGAYYNWSSSESAVLGQAKVAAGKLVLKPRGFALPHYADCSKIGFVLQGDKGGAGLITPGGKDKGTAAYIALQKGDIIPVPLGSVSWWYNHGPSDLVITFIGETSKAWVPGEITYFLLTGAQGNLTAFSPEFIGKAFSMDANKAQKIAGSQKGVLIIKLSQEEANSIPVYSTDIANTWTRSIENSPPDVAVENGGSCITLTGAKFPFLEDVGLSATRLKLERCAVRAPTYTADGSTQVIYVAKGSGKVQIVGLNGNLTLDDEVKTGQLFVVPKFFTVTLSAADEGMECVSIITSPRPIIGELGGQDSVLNINPSVLQISLDLTSEIANQFRKMMKIGTLIVPPSSTM
ncbi:hypothetical protein SLE2022_037150 [Rubroshorea leprosula]